MPTPTNPVEVRDALGNHLEKRSSKFRTDARRNEHMASLVRAATILASFLAALTSAFPDSPRLLVTILAIIPGTALVISTTFGFDRRALWHRRRRYEYEAARMRLLYEGAAAPDISREIREFEQAAQSERPRQIDFKPASSRPST
jgi:hypothetical protein